MKCSLEPAKKNVKRKPLRENFVKENFTEEREESQKELHRHCEEVYTDQGETIEYFKKKGDQQFAMEGRTVQITVDLMVQARAKMSDNKVNGPEDAIASEMINQLPLEKIYTITKCFQQRFMVQMESPSSWKIVKLVFLRKLDAEPKKGIRSYRAIALSSVMSRWCASCVILRLEKEKEPEIWKTLHIGGVEGKSCQHLQVMITNLLQKHWDWQEERNPMLKRGSVVRPTMYLASLDIKTAFDEARPKHVAKIMDNHDTHMGG